MTPFSLPRETRLPQVPTHACITLLASLFPTERERELSCALWSSSPVSREAITKNVAMGVRSGCAFLDHLFQILPQPSVRSGYRHTLSFSLTHSLGQTRTLLHSSGFPLEKWASWRKASPALKKREGPKAKEGEEEADDEEEEEEEGGTERNDYMQTRHQSAGSLISGHQNFSATCVPSRSKSDLTPSFHRIFFSDSNLRPVPYIDGQCDGQNDSSIECGWEEIPNDEAGYTLEPCTDEEKDCSADYETQASSTSTKKTISSPCLAGDEDDPILHEWMIDPRDLEVSNRVLGKGYFGEVRKGSFFMLGPLVLAFVLMACHERSGKWRGTRVAVKTIYRNAFRSRSDAQLFEKEVSMLRSLHHPHIIQ